MMRTGANAVSVKATSWAVMVVSMLDPNISPTLFLKDRTPALTSPIVITKMAEPDWMMAVIIAPSITPTTSKPVACPSDFPSMPVLITISSSIGKCFAVDRPKWPKSLTIHFQIRPVECPIAHQEFIKSLVRAGYEADFLNGLNRQG